MGKTSQFENIFIQIKQNLLEKNSSCGLKDSFLNADSSYMKEVFESLTLEEENLLKSNLAVYFPIDQLHKFIESFNNFQKSPTTENYNLLRLVIAGQEVINNNKR